MPAPTRLLHLVSTHLWSGPAEPVLTLGAAQRARGDEVTLAWDRVRAPQDFTPHVAAAGIDALAGVALSNRAPPLRQLSDALTLRRLWRAGAYDVLHAHLSHDHTLAALTAPGASAPRPLLVRSLHHERSLEPRPLQAWLHRRADGFVTLCEAHRDRLAARHDVPIERIAVVAGAIDPAPFEVADLAGAGALIRAELGIAADAPVIGMVARFNENRRQEVLVRAFAALRARVRGAQLVLAGRGERVPEIRALCASLGLDRGAGIVHFVGYRPAELAAIFASFDIAVMLREGNDGSARAALQAMAAGRPLVVTARPVLGGLVDGASGAVAPEDAPEALADVLVRLVEAGPRRLRVMGLAARARVRERHAPSRQADAVADFYARLRALGPREP